MPPTRSAAAPLGLYCTAFGIHCQRNTTAHSSATHSGFFFDSKIASIAQSAPSAAACAPYGTAQRGEPRRETPKKQKPARSTGLVDWLMPPATQGRRQRSQLLGGSILGSGSGVRGGVCGSLGSLCSSSACVFGGILGSVCSVASSSGCILGNFLGGVSSSSTSVLGCINSVRSSGTSSSGCVLGCISGSVGSILGGFSSRCWSRSLNRSWCRSSSFFLLAASGQCNSSDQRSENNGLLHLDIPNHGGFF